MSDYGLLTGFWRCCRPKIPYHGAYPSGFLLKARRALGVPLSEPILHVCSGRAADYSKPEFGITKGTAQRGFGPSDRTLDLDPALQPDFLQDAREPFPPASPICGYCGGTGEERLQDGSVLSCGGCAGIGLGDEWADGWPGILIDRPYTPDDADHYAPGRAALPDLSLLLKNAAAVLQPGRRVGVLDYLVPSPAAGLELVALYAVMCGFNNRVRAFSVYERLEHAKP